MAHKEFVNCVINCEPISSRIIKIRLNALPFKVTIVQVYAPTSEHPDEEVENFYQLLNKTIDKLPRKDITVIQGDWNAKIGTNAHQNWAGTVGKFGLGQTDERA